MNKGQSIVIQFLIFFLIGFSIFVSLGSFFNYQSEIFRQNILSSGVNLSKSYISSAVIAMVDSCKECDFVKLTIKIHNTSAGYPILVRGENLALIVSTPVSSVSTTIHNLLGDVLKVTGSSPSTKPIVLTFNRTNNNLEVR
ncbi:MAG: hypothetical protein QW058_01570 [Candidatus Aenigmatarchaeota archaeon]